MAGNLQKAICEMKGMARPFPLVWWPAANTDVNRTRTRILSGGAGAVLLVFAIGLQDAFPGRDKEVQIAVWSVIVVSLAALGNYKHLREPWFWKGFFLGSFLHVVILYHLKTSMPFHSLGVAILAGFLEVIVWQVIFRGLSAIW